MATRKAMLAYKVVETAVPPQFPLGSVFLVDEWLGHRHVFQRYDYESLTFNPTHAARYLGRVTARTDSGKIRQILALPGTSALRRKITERRNALREENRARAGTAR